MNTHEERFHFVLHFAEMNLNFLREGDWLNLQEDVMHFLGWFSQRQAEITREAVATLQSEVAEVLYEIAGLSRRTVTSPAIAVNSERKRIYQRPKARHAKMVKIGTGQVFHFDVATVQGLTFDCSTPGALRLGIKAALRDSFFFALGVVLTKADLARLRQCPVCVRLFYAEHGRQQFCGPQCATRQRVQRFRKQKREESVPLLSPASSTERKNRS